MSNEKNMVNTYKQQLMFVSQQKQQLQFQINILDSSIKELEKTSEKRVFKGVGNIFIMTDKTDVLKQTKDSKETVELKLKKLEKQESEIIKKLNEFSKENSSKKQEGNKENVEGVA
ncbi:MAG: prefoldin subunit [Candidatus ainarchaeum sp.]|nr:prefoldin subunit [Candidatus ainarchaeum sp.]